MGEDDSNTTVAPSTTQLSDREALAENLEALRRLPEDERKQSIAQAFVVCATSSPTGDNKYIPLFERKGLRDSDALRELVTDIGVTYTDMLLMQRANALQIPEESGMHENPILEFMETAIAKEMVLFNEEARKQLGAYQAELEQYAPSHPQNAADKLIGSIINLSMNRVVPALTGFEASTNIDPVDLHVPKMDEGRWVLEQHYHGLKSLIGKDRTTAMDIITGRKI